MSRLSGRIDKLEADNGSGLRVFVWINPDAGETAAQAEAKYIAEHGPLPRGAEVILFQWQAEATRN